MEAFISRLLHWGGTHPVAATVGGQQTHLWDPDCIRAKRYQAASKQQSSRISCVDLNNSNQTWWFVVDTFSDWDQHVISWYPRRNPSGRDGKHDTYPETPANMMRYPTETYSPGSWNDGLWAPVKIKHKRFVITPEREHSGPISMMFRCHDFSHVTNNFPLFVGTRSSHVTHRFWTRLPEEVRRAARRSFWEAEGTKHWQFFHSRFFVGEPTKPGWGDGTHSVGRFSVRNSVDAWHNCSSPQIALWVMHLTHGRDENAIRMCGRITTHSEATFCGEAESTWCAKKEIARPSSHTWAAAVALTHWHCVQHCWKWQHCVRASQQVSLQGKWGANGIQKQIKNHDHAGTGSAQANCGVWFTGLRHQHRTQIVFCSAKKAFGVWPGGLSVMDGVSEMAWQIDVNTRFRCAYKLQCHHDHAGYESRPWNVFNFGVRVQGFVDSGAWSEATIGWDLWEADAWPTHQRPSDSDAEVDLRAAEETPGEWCRETKPRSSKALQKNQARRKAGTSDAWRTCGAAQTNRRWQTVMLALQHGQRL